MRAEYGLQFTKDEGKTKYTHITTIGEYSILKREVKFEPYLCVHHLSYWDEGNEYVWDQGHYYDTEEEALLYALTRYSISRAEGTDFTIGINTFSGVKFFGIREIEESEDEE